ncbi:STAS domain-containing protein [Kitasatospora sp. NPDC059146]|uniref:STAS domain-containing protein n=1 Tax=unclassified Kitasatospora TaxID=2633591 RepID=UPI00368053CF
MTDHRNTPGMAVLALSGELDYDRGAELSEQLDAAVAARPPVLAVELAEVTFADSFALRLLVLADRRMRSEGGLLLLVGPLTSAVSRLLEVTATDRHFTLAPDPREAARMAAAFRRPPTTGTGPT